MSMFKMSLNNFDYNTFDDYDEYRYVGQSIIVVMVLGVSIVLVNAIIAKFGVISFLILVYIFYFYLLDRKHLIKLMTMFWEFGR